MIKDNPNARPEVLNSLSREPVGHELAARVATRLAKGNGKRGIWYSHRDYCGHGLVYLENQFRLEIVHDGMPRQDEELYTWDNEADFVEWLAKQSDFSLSGADELEPPLHSTHSWTLNNQRLNYSRLIKYVASDLVPPVFRHFLAAVGEEFEFLVIDYNFRMTAPEMYGHECVVGYIKPGVAGITVTSEPKSLPFITVSLNTSDPDKSYSNKLLDGLAKQRRPGWKRPALNPDRAKETALRRYFANYVALLRSDFQELLTAERADTSGQSENTTTTAVRVSGALIALVAVVVMIIELRYFTVHDTPEATGSAYSNLGLLIMMGLPWIVLVAGFLQLFSGVYIHKYESVFAAMTLANRLGVALGATGLSILVTALAVWSSS